MNRDEGLNNLLKWSIENSSASQDPSAAPREPTQAARGLDPQTLAALMGGPSDADLMRESMTAIVSPDVDLENKLVAFDNFEQLIENLDNANNMEALGLWAPLVQQLRHEDGDMRRMACWCVATAVQNNEKSQERLLATGAVLTLMNLALEDSTQAVRKKAILALSSTARNYQPGLDAVVENLPEARKPAKALDAADMEDVDSVIQPLRDESQQRG
ncbi:hypothetical protein LTS18_008249 [Coniosporium uncinatum]|uniref:Uncharacterized protein n=1 Tax=Coniosporium uncinatum TaxID=93489 RepID=A0ACC3D1S3_9PEZI|nr:hypothetical protein LTS18_008249 [Coniosporium uncinatum]